MTRARSDVVGSLLRPAELLAARERHGRGEIGDEDLRAAEDAAVDEALRRQADAGLEVVTDGELRRLSFQSQMVEAVDGFGDWDLDAFLWGEWKSAAVGDVVLELDNHVIGGAPAGVTFGFHLCRGNQGSRWLVEGSYEALAGRIFPRIGAERLLLEYDDERSGGFEPLRLVPEDKTVVLGLVTTKTQRPESPDGLARRIESAARYVPLERLALSPQCGFGTSVVGNALSQDDQWAKLRTVAETAALVWG